MWPWLVASSIKPTRREGERGREYLGVDRQRSRVRVIIGITGPMVAWVLRSVGTSMQPTNRLLELVHETDVIASAIGGSRGHLEASSG